MKLLPNDIDAEQSVLGACLIDQELIVSAVEKLVNDDFYREDHKIIFSCINSLFLRNEPVDIITLKNELESIGKFENVGGLDYLSFLPEKVPTTANVKKYINIIKDKSIKRKLIEMSNKISELSFDPMIKTDELTNIAEPQVRDSGNIEQDADMVMFIHREDYYEATPENKDIAEINFAKFRAGEPGIEKLIWKGEYTKFLNLSWK